MMQAAVRKSGASASRRVLGSSTVGSTRAMSGKEIKFGVEGRAAMLKGVDTLADAVQVSFTFLGRSENLYRFPMLRFLYWYW